MNTYKFYDADDVVVFETVAMSTPAANLVFEFNFEKTPQQAGVVARSDKSEVKPAPEEPPEPEVEPPAPVVTPDDVVLDVILGDEEIPPRPSWSGAKVW